MKTGRIQQMSSENTNYDSSNIQILEGLEPVRKRPGMYIGNTAEEGLHHLVYEVVDNSVDEALAGFCKNIKVTLKKNDYVEVVDDGRGIPVDIHKELKVSALEIVMTKLHAGRLTIKPTKSPVVCTVWYLCCQRPTSAVTVQRDGKYGSKVFKGSPLAPIKSIGTTKTTGTKVLFHPDSSIFCHKFVRYIVRTIEGDGFSQQRDQDRDL